MRTSIFLLLSAATETFGCALHAAHGYSNPIGRRQGKNDPGRAKRDWAYDESYNWGNLKPDYALCQAGTQQSPIALTLSQGLSQTYNPNFSGYEKRSKVSGTWFNWGYGPGFTLDRGATGSEDEFTSLPSMTFDNDTPLYLLGWHVHSPAEHVIDGYRSRSELHMVHVNSEGRESAVVSIRLDPQGPSSESASKSSISSFFDQLPPLIPVTSMDQSTIEVDVSLALKDIRQFPTFADNTFWTYAGSLTSPPCKEGLRWFVARDVLYIGVEQMKGILGNSSYGARIGQTVWDHGVNR